MKWITCLLVLSLLFAGCTKPSSEPESKEEIWENVNIKKTFGHETGLISFQETEMELSDGRNLTCMAMYAPIRGGLSCDWESANNEGE